VSPQEALSHIVWILVSVVESVVRAVIARPPLARALERSATKEQQSSLHRPSGLVGTMAEEPMIASSNAEASKEVPNDSNHKRLPPQQPQSQLAEPMTDLTPSHSPSHSASPSASQ
jgi:hypothetical protein